ncbi:protein-O-mannosyltransferase-like protein [Motilibacter peucedani]|uniref:Polyprenol-phosphate-mannose--protein mannosyltransferase n=1 Tax=Motilibacter peucedani TaxID=598650 RepID=A0A420XKE4_9ACTN|nr:phospholipid carrier-dependent glycosyltransferase [Motilibacter peucedani]RKS68592.1 protein-O-mannosyltransferase-like protein [Motilibacter peucedani]
MSTTVTEAPRALTTRPRGYASAVRERLVTPMPSDRVIGWLGPVLVAALAGCFHFWRLGKPAAIVFDEKFYPQEAQSMLHYGVEYAVPYDGPPPATPGPDFVVHPPLGKWVIAVGEKLFGYHLHSAHPDGFGWRFSVALLGTLGVLVVARTGRRLFRSTLLGCVAGLLLATDGLHLVESRTALLDPVLTFWALCAFACVVVDRDWVRRRLADTVTNRRDHSASSASLGLRPWLLGAGLFLGMACGTKWNGAFFVVAYGLLALVWTTSARRTAGAERPYLDTLRRDVPVFVVYLALLPLVVYIASWTGWFLSDPAHAWDRGWAAKPENAGRYPLLPTDALKSLWYYHHEMYDFNVGLAKFHAYKSNPWSWLILGRPTAFWFQRGTDAQYHCGAGTCDEVVTALGTPALWWASIPAIGVLLYRMVGRRDYRAAAILTAIGAGYLPWFNYQHRTIFSFYAVVFSPYIALAVTMVIGLALGGARASVTRRTWSAAAAGAYVLLVVANFAYLYPILTSQSIPDHDWLSRMWFQSWI